MTSAPPSRDRRIPVNSWLWAASLFLTMLGAKLWFIGRFGTSLPFWDHWEEARVVFIPYFHGQLNLADLISPHSEHRPFFTRVYGLLLMLWNGQWDARLEMVGDAILHSLLLTGFGCLVVRYVGGKCWPLLWLPLAAVVALPFAWENTLGAFHSMFFFMLAFSLPTLWLLGLHPAWSLRWWLGVATGFCALFSVASGFIAAAAVFGLVALKILKRPGSWRRHLPTLAVCAAFTLAGVLLKTDVEVHHKLMAHSVSDFVTALGKFLAWPWIVLPPLAVVNFLPLALVGWFWFRSGEERLPAEELALVTGLWTILSGAASAFARGVGGAHPQWRYMDSSSFALTVNAVAVLILLARYRGRTWLGRWDRLACLGWALMNLAGLFLLCDRAWRLDIPEREFYTRSWVRNVRAYLITGDVRHLTVKQKEQRALFYPDMQLAYLGDENVRSRLPASVRDPLKIVPATPPGGAFVPRGWSLRKPDPPWEVSWGSFNAQGAAATGRFESQPLPASRLPFLEIEVAGDLGQPGLSLELVEEATGKRTPVSSPGSAAGWQPSPRLLTSSPTVSSGGPAGGWQKCQVKAPPGRFHLVATDDSPTGWFAFKEPRELGRLSWWCDHWMRLGAAQFYCGLGLYALALALRFRPRRGA
jgi:hypothetical protein